MATECGPFHFGLVRARERTSKNGGYSGYTTTKHRCGPDVSRDRGVATGYIFSGYTMATVATRQCLRGWFRGGELCSSFSHQFFALRKLEVFHFFCMGKLFKLAQHLCCTYDTWFKIEFYLGATKMF